MPTYTVSIPLAGAIHIEVEAENAKAAKDAAWEKLNEEGEKAGDVEWEFFDTLTEGNVSHAPFNEIEATKHREEKKP